MNKLKVKKTIEKLQSEISFKNMCFTQIRQSELAAAEIIYELFDEYLHNLQHKIIKKGYELAINAWVEERAENFISKSSFEIKEIVRIRFAWEPIADNVDYQDVSFTAKQLVTVNQCLNKFGESIGLDVVLMDEF